VIGPQALVVWQIEQSSEVTKWLEGLPVLSTPLWQEPQEPVICPWSKLAGSQALVEWQVSQEALVTMWFDGLPVAPTPL
jgi:hypothetical protein